MSYCVLILHQSFSSHFPSLYLSLVLFALAPFSLFISFQLFQLLKRDVLFYQMKQSAFAFDNDVQLFDYFSVLVNKKLWLDAIKIMEKNSVLRKFSLHRYFNALGFVYCSIQEYDLAKIYYIRALEIQNDYVVALLNLAKVYQATKETVFLISTCKTILKYDPLNKMAARYLESKT